MFAMNYYTLAQRIIDEKNSEKLWIKILYYGIICFDILMLFLTSAVNPSKRIILATSFVTTCLLFSLLSVVVLFLALRIIK
jgi:hypothetical protein